jgi:hypothetical protein
VPRPFNVWTKVEGILSTQQHFPPVLPEDPQKECALIMEDIKLPNPEPNAEHRCVRGLSPSPNAVLLVIPDCFTIVFLLIDNTLKTDHLAQTPLHPEMSHFLPYRRSKKKKEKKKL